MKMLLCHNFYINRGGESEVFENEVRGLRQMGHEVVVYARRNEEIADWSAVKKV